MNDLPDFDEWDNSDTNRNNPEFEVNNSVESIAFIEKLKSSSKEIMMDLIYKAIIENEMGALNNNSPKEEKIAAIGVRLRKWITLHGLSINVDPDLSHFQGIVPCGIKEHGVTSLVDLGLPVSMTDLDNALRKSFSKVF